MKSGGGGVKSWGEEEVGSKGMSETRAEDVTPLTERKSINSSFLWHSVCDEGLQPSQHSEADVRAPTEGLYHYIIS